jgi:hypothetical protein
MTLEDLHQRHAAAERRAVLAELDAIDAALDVIEQRFGTDDEMAETRRRIACARAHWLAGRVTVH